MSSLIGLDASAENYVTGYQFWEMQTTLNITGESSYKATKMLTSALCQGQICVARLR